MVGPKDHGQAACTRRTPRSWPRSRPRGPPRRDNAGSACGTGTAGTTSPPLTAAGQPPAAPPPDPLPAGPGDPLARVEDWVTGWAEQAAADLFATGEAVITTSRGTVQAWLSRPAWRRGRALRIQARGDNGVTGTSTRNLGREDDQELRRDVVTYLTFDLIGLVGG